MKYCLQTRSFGNSAHEVEPSPLHNIIYIYILATLSFVRLELARFLTQGQGYQPLVTRLKIVLVSFFLIHDIIIHFTVIVICSSTFIVHLTTCMWLPETFGSFDSFFSPSLKTAATEAALWFCSDLYNSFQQ